MLPEKTMTDVATKLAFELADKLFAAKGAELDAAIKLANVMYIQKCDNLDKHLEAKYLGSLPYDHGHYNDREHYNTYSNKTIFHMLIELMNCTRL